MISKSPSPRNPLSFETASAVRNLLWLAAFLTALLSCRELQSQVASVSAAPSSRLLPPPSSFRFPDSQKFVYSVEWHRLNAGVATILVERVGAREHLHSTADTLGMVNQLYPVHDSFDAEIDPRTFCTLQISKHNQEGSRRLHQTIQFDYPNGKSRVDDYDLKTGRRKHAEFEIPSCVSDVISGFFYASSLRLAPGSVEIFPVNESGKTSDIRIEVEGENKIKVPLGQFETLRVKAEPISGPMRQKAEVWVWFSQDVRRIPVQMKSKLGFASLLFQLQRIEGGSR
jgi:Protein of unknown function (DUF3108)